MSWRLAWFGQSHNQSAKPQGDKHKITDEELLRLLEGCGFDFDSTVRELEARFPRKADWGVEGFQIVPLELRSAFAGFEPAVWKVPFFGELDLDLPPQRYTYEYHPTQDAHENHQRSVANLSPLFGPGEATNSTNVYDRIWEIGFFRVKTTTWPRKWNRQSDNGFEGKNPFLWLSANITIEPKFPFVRSTDDYAIPFETLIAEATNSASRVYTRRNRVSCGESGARAGVSSDSFLIRSADTTTRIPLEDIEAVKHHRVDQGRGPEESKLELDTLYLGKHAVKVTVAEGPKRDSLDMTAKQLASALTKPLTVYEYSND